MKMKFLACTESRRVGASRCRTVGLDDGMKCSKRTLAANLKSQKQTACGNHARFRGKHQTASTQRHKGTKTQRGKALRWVAHPAAVSRVCRNATRSLSKS